MKECINPEGMDDAEQAFGHQLMHYWVNFITTSSPNGPNVDVHWPKSEKLLDYLDFGIEILIPPTSKKPC